MPASFVALFWGGWGGGGGGGSGREIRELKLPVLSQFLISMLAD